MRCYARSRVNLLLMLFLGSLFWGEQVFADESNVLVMSGTEYKPWNYVENGKHKGIVSEILGSAVEGIGRQLDVKLMPHRRIYAALVGGEVDISLFATTYADSGAHSEVLYLGRESVLELEIAAMSMAKKDILIKSPKEFSGYNLGGIRLLKRMHEAFVPKGIYIAEYVDAEAIVKALISERIDIGISATANLVYAANSLDIGNELVVSHAYEQKGRYVIAVSRLALGENAKQISEQLDQAVMEMKQRGELAEIIKKYSDLKYFDGYGRASRPVSMQKSVGYH